MHWHEAGRKSVWPVASLASRLDDWREVYRAWREGALFTSEAADAMRAGARQEVSTEMHKLGVAHLSTEPLAYRLDTETAYPAIVGPDGERRGTLEVSAVPCSRDGAPLGGASTVAQLLQRYEDLPLSAVGYHARHSHLSRWFFARAEFALAEHQDSTAPVPSELRRVPPPHFAAKLPGTLARCKCLLASLAERPR